MSQDHKEILRFSEHGNFPLILRKFWIQTWFCNWQQYLCLFYLVFECIPNIHDQRVILVLPIQILGSVLTFHIGSIFCFFPANLMSSTYTDKNNPCFTEYEWAFPIGDFIPSVFQKDFLKLPFPYSPARRWPYRFRSRRTTESSTLDHDFGHLCRGRRIHMSGHSDLGIFNNFGASSIFTREKADTASAACPAQPGSLDLISMTFAAVICDADDPCSVKLHKIQNHLSQCRLGVHLDLCIFGALSPIGHSSNDRSPSMKRSVLFYLLFMLHQSLQICFWLLFCPTEDSFQVSPIFYPLLLLLRVSSLFVSKE